MKTSAFAGALLASLALAAPTLVTADASPCDSPAACPRFGLAWDAQGCAAIADSYLTFEQRDYMDSCACFRRCADDPNACRAVNFYQEFDRTTDALVWKCSLYNASVPADRCINYGDANVRVGASFFLERP